MNQRLLAFFSGFPDYRFPETIAKRLFAELTKRGSLVFVSAWPDDYSRNDDDSHGMHGLFEDYQMPFARHCVIDNRTESARARELIGEASCVFLMGGHPGYQRKLLREKGLDTAIRETGAAILGVSAGSINMALHSLDTKDSPIPYDGLGLADITVKPHFTLDNEEVRSTILSISRELPICAMEDNSAIFVTNDDISFIGNIYWVSKGEISPLMRENLIDKFDKRL